ncbi:uncharacterized protein LOC121655130 isoform X2 [Melanotaenia boesemani]|uniref:uncharacterized protein LOC121655130 isoform X2 n=1 Tax=Melanotaenia boesemani TaxID=1250792 RepID=UPI001C0423C0|nr:uncharacterized protein LOC121655130 isoform X2 [Melanotaenia boesemani]
MQNWTKPEKKAMDSVDICAATSTGDNKRRVNKKNRNWHKRLHLRKSVVQPPAMQSEDKNGPKKIAEEWEQTTVWPSSKKPHQEVQQSQCMTNDSGKTLRFTCSQCKDNLEYVPKDLVRHFEEKHRGNPPAFPCYMCTFTTHEFSYLQVHLLRHKDTFSSCSLCNDNIQRTWPEFNAHLAKYHCPNGKYSCEICQKFSTGDVRVFLEHIYGHTFDLKEADDQPLLRKDKNQLSSTQISRCQYCGFEASRKWLITKHVKAVHVCQNGSQKREKRGIHAIAIKPNESIPTMNSRLTRSAVKGMCWLTQDCLSLPGREFLDKYCHLSDPKTTLEETQQFLMNSVAGETDDQKWTKALKTVLSNVPQDVNLHPKLENGIVSNPSDLAVLTVKNKITVAQNGATYAKRLKVMTSTEKRSACPESSASDAQCAGDQRGCESNLKDVTPCLQDESKLHNDISISVHNEPSRCTGMQENRENQEIKHDQEAEDQSEKLERPTNRDGLHVTCDTKLTNEGEEKMSVRRALPRRKTQNQWRKRRSRFKKAGKKSKGQTLKMVLKKNPVKVKQFVSQSPLSPCGGGVIDGHPGLPSPRRAEEETVQILHNKQLGEKTWTKGSTADPFDPSKAITSILQPEPGEELARTCSVKPAALEDATGNVQVILKDQEMQADAEKLRCFLEAGAEQRSAGGTSQTDPSPASLAEKGTSHDTEQLQKSLSGADCCVSDEKGPAVDRVTHHGGRSSPVSPPQGEMNEKDSCLEPIAHQSDQIIEGTSNGKPAANSGPDLLSSIYLPPGKAIQQESSPASGHRWQPAPKHQERILKLVAINPSQLVKRPAGDQPVVVLNHPDADIPQVARIMEIVNRHREVQKVVLSRRTLNALSALNDEVPETDEPTDSPAEQGNPSVQERFTLRLKFRRLNRKKYEIVGAVSPSRDFVSKFPCWFCGRVFTSQETMMAHRQRHLMEWKSPNCENS